MRVFISCATFTCHNFSNKRCQIEHKRNFSWLTEMDNSTYIFIVCFISIVQWSYSLNNRLEIFDICSPDNGVCLKMDSCPHVKEAFKRGEYTPRICSYVGLEPIICCVDDIKSKWAAEHPTSISYKMCELYRNEICPNSIPFVIGGTEVLPKELPFMALIGFRSGGEMFWLCGGSLISPNYILSAAHCNRDSPLWARLGELDLSTETDDAKPQQFRIVDKKIHPQYKQSLGYNDIMLFKLDREAKFNKYIRPICLSQIQSSTSFGDPIVAAGWGRTETAGPQSKKLLKVNLELFSTSRCDRTENAIQYPRGLDERTMICAGSSKGGLDTCQGDSGGPLFLEPSTRLKSRQCFLYTQVGITSNGYLCGEKEFPGLYINVNPYIPWIESIVWPSNVTDPSVIWSHNE